MRKEGRENAEWGFRMPAPGWHAVSIQEGIDILLNEKSGKQSLMIPASIDEGSDDDGIRVTVFCPYKDENGNYVEFGEQKAADLLVACDLFKKFEEKFPGDVSLFDDPIVEAMKLKLPGTFCKMKVEISADAKYTNVVGVAKMTADTSAKAAAPAKTKEAKAPAASKKAVDW